MELSVKSIHLNRIKLPPPIKGYLCFQIDGITAHSSYFEKSISLLIAIKYALSSDTFEQQHITLKRLFYTRDQITHDINWVIPPLHFQNCLQAHNLEI